MVLIPIDKNTRWECQFCGNCCRTKKEDFCDHFDHETKRCREYEKRPFICRMYPLYADLEKMNCSDGVARPSVAFALENLRIHTECPGYGKGKRVYANKNLQRKLEKIAHDIGARLKMAIEKKISEKDVLQ